MPKVKLDHAFCLTAGCQAGKRKTDYWDTVVSGFVLEVRAGGGRTYALRYIDAGGVQRQHKIGRFGDITFDQAKKKAARLRSEVVLGGNPAGEKETRRAIPRYADLAARHALHAETYQRSWWSTEGILRRHLVPRWGCLRLDEIQSEAIARWLADKAAEGLKPSTIDKIRVTLGKSFALAAEWGVPGAETNPVRRVKRPRYDNARHRYLSVDEASRLLRACDQSPNVQLGSIVRLLLYTGARKSELLQARWEHIDLERKTWLIPMSKTGKSRHVPLSQAAITVIKQLPRFGCSYLVPNPETELPFVTLKRAWATAVAGTSLQDVRLHDLRHSCASFLVNASQDLYVVGRILGHADVKSSARYSHLSSEKLLAAVEARAAKMNGNGF